MIDLHCHMLPGIDDGARDLDTALRMAELAVADGITLTACTPHIYPQVFENTHAGIRRAIDDFRAELESARIPLDITYGADIQVVPSLVDGLDNGSLPSLHNSRYFLFEPPHHVALPRLADLVHGALLAGYVPIITHPERLAYIESDYQKFIDAARAGAWLQLTGGSLLGRFGKQVQRVAEHFLRDGAIHLLASDGHDLHKRTPELGEARQAAAVIVGEEESWRLVRGRPEAVIANAEPGAVQIPAGLAPGWEGDEAPRRGAVRWLSWLVGR